MDDPVPLAAFARASRTVGADPSTRWKAGGLTGGVYVLLGLLALLPSPTPPEVTIQVSLAITSADLARPKTDRPPPPFLAHLIKPRAVSLSPPDFTVATAAPPAPTPMTASITPVSPLLGGVTDGDSASAGSANGIAGNGNAVSGCFDAAWARAVRDRIGHFYFIPSNIKTESGMVMVHFIVRRNGRLNFLAIANGSGNKWLDRAATEMVRRAQPLPALPDRMHADRADVEIPILFNAKRDDNPSPGTC